MKFKFPQSKVNCEENGSKGSSYQYSKYVSVVDNRYRKIFLLLGRITIGLFNIFILFKTDVKKHKS